MQCTTLRLSTQKQTLRFAKKGPHNSTAITMGKNSNNVKFLHRPASCHTEGHGSAHQCVPNTAPNPTEPDALVNKCKSVLSCSVAGQQVLPLYYPRKIFQTNRSSLIFCVMRILWLGAEAPLVARDNLQEKNPTHWHDATGKNHEA